MPSMSRSSCQVTPMFHCPCFDCGTATGPTDLRRLPAGPVSADQWVSVPNRPISQPSSLRDSRRCQTGYDHARDDEQLARHGARWLIPSLTNHLLHELRPLPATECGPGVLYRAIASGSSGGYLCEGMNDVAGGSFHTAVLPDVGLGSPESDCLGLPQARMAILWAPSG